MIPILRELTEDNKQEAARVVADRLIRHAEGDHRDPATWKRVAAKYPVDVYEYYAPRGGRGEFFAGPENGSNTIGAISINTARTPVEVASAWIHELAHCDIHIWIPPQCRNGFDFHHYEGHVESIRHDIASIVETLILP